MMDKNKILEQWEDALKIPIDQPDNEKVPITPSPELEKKQKQSDRKKTIPTPPVNEKNPVNRVGKLTRDRRASFDWIEPNLLKDLETATKRAKIGNVQISWARTGHDVGSRHEYGYAVDLSMLNGKGYNGNQTEFTILGNILVAELIKLGYTYGEGANEKSYIWQTAEHYNHVHVSRKPLADAKKQKPADLNQANQSDIHKKIRRARWNIYKILTKYPDEYFQNFKSAFKPGAGGRVIGGDNEKAAAKWLKDSFNTVWEPQFKKWETVAHPYDVSNMRTIRLIVQWAITLILEQYSGKYPVTFWNYDTETKKWKRVKRTYVWNYM